MKTKLWSAGRKEVAIGNNAPTVLIGERINPFGKGPIKEALLSGAMEPIREEALKQVEAGADILNVSVNAFGIDEGVVLPRVISEIMRAVDVPLCLESRNPVALEETLMLGCGKPIISSVTGEDRIQDEILPLVKKYNTAIVTLASDASGIPKEPLKRLQVIKQIIDRTDKMDIPREDLLVDCIAESSAVNDQAAVVTLETMRIVKRELGVNLILGASNVSFGLPNRSVINSVFLALALQAGLTCAMVNAAKMKPYLMAADLLLGRDPWARRYVTYYRSLQSVSSH
ncbi:MAG TPA: dihydropteroate synthase [Thermodesulfobacteriota bacterium]|nr:dihydropteroate synthase [Thermodesulfobacteriota bacterium]